MTRHDYIIAIDPDVEKSGVAVLRVATKYIVCECLAFPKLLDHILFCKEMASKENDSMLVIVEAGHEKRTIIKREEKYSRFYFTECNDYAKRENELIKQLQHKYNKYGK